MQYFIKDFSLAQSKVEHHSIDGLMQKGCNTSALAVDLCFFCF